MAINIRPAISYTVTTLPPNGIVSQAAFQGLEDGATSFHQRGKLAASAHGGTEKGVFKPILGYKVAGVDHQQTVGPFVSITPKFSIPSGYNRFSLMVRRWSPYAIIGFIPRVAEFVTTCNFLGGKGDRYEIFSGGTTGNSEAYQIFQGNLPFAANIGTMTTAYLELTFGVRAVDGGVAQGERITLFGNGATYVGFRSISLTLYKDDQC